jgi:hypothetical protein
MKFKQGNPGGPGRPRGHRTRARVEFEQLAREMLDNTVEKSVMRLLRSRNDMVVLRTLEFLALRGFGRPAIAIHDLNASIDDVFAPGSPMAMVMEMSNMPIPQRPQRALDSEQRDE